MDKLRSEGEAQNTIVFYVSDNGNFFGEHRRSDGKSDVYEPSLNVPYAVKMPRVYRSGPRVDHSGAVVSNQDIAATIVDYANRYTGPVQTCASPGDCRRLDGRTLAPLVGGGGVWPVRRGVLDEINSGDHDYDAIRTPRFAYSELATGGARALRPAHGPLRAAQPGRRSLLCRDPVPPCGPPGPSAPLLGDPGS